MAATLLTGLRIEPTGLAAVWRWLCSPGRKGWATIVQLVGTIVTATGLAFAWLRAKYRTDFAGLLKLLLKLLRKWIRRLICGPAPMVIKAESAQSKFTPGIPIVYKTYPINKNLTTKENLQKLADLVNEYIPKFETDLTALRIEITQVRAHASGLAADTLRHLQDQIAELRRDIDAKQVLDLRWASVGLVITGIGIALGYGT
ncbi:hypothetical protein [Mycobacterium interjectum]|uniref:hypothetical protein n=1 Tax=Mycobacterium interjectum TaxID=33895 RepID=UPI001156004B|nr:hypothetical protein [Mycobacterium interjectum]MCV7092029.1 hypothetical protein [Mycobacterium interjectum]